MRINYKGANHLLSAFLTGNSFIPFDPASQLHSRCIGYVSAAMFLMKTKGYLNPQCNYAFRKLPNGRPFDELLGDENIWVSILMNDYVLAQSSEKDIAVSMLSFSQAFKRKDGVDYIASILVHELAHVNGAPMSNMQAEDVLLPCGFSQFYNPNSHS